MDRYRVLVAPRPPSSRFPHSFRLADNISETPFVRLHELGFHFCKERFEEGYESRFSQFDLIAKFQLNDRFLSTVFDRLVLLQHTPVLQEGIAYHANLVQRIAVLFLKRSGPMNDEALHDYDQVAEEERLKSVHRFAASRFRSRRGDQVLVGSEWRLQSGTAFVNVVLFLAVHAQHERPPLQLPRAPHLAWSRR